MAATTVVGFVKNVIKLTGSTMKAIDYEEENTKRVTALELTGGPAHGGLTVLDWFAGKALSSSFYPALMEALRVDSDLDCELVAEFAYTMASAMLKEREKRYTPTNVVTGVTGKTYG